MFDWYITNNNEPNVNTINELAVARLMWGYLFRKILSFGARL